MSEADQITQVLQAIGRTEAGASEKLLPLVYDDLRRLAMARMANEMSGHTLQPTALVSDCIAVFEEFVGPVMTAPLARAESYALAIASTGRTNSETGF